MHVRLMRCMGLVGLRVLGFMGGGFRVERPQGLFRVERPQGFRAYRTRIG